MNLNYFINQITIYLPDILKAFAALGKDVSVCGCAQ